MTAPPPRPLGDAVRDALPTYKAPDELREWARAQLSIASLPAARSSRSRNAWRFAYAAGLIVAVAAGFGGRRYIDAMHDRSAAHGVLVAELVDTHVRSLMAAHLTDVRSSDHHTVKPWFAGKVPFAPQVPELQAEGFPLVGGRAEYVAGRTTAALVYARGAHTINLFIWTVSATDGAAPVAAYNGYALVHWSDRGLTYWAVSDAAASELAAFERAYRAASAQ